MYEMNEKETQIAHLPLSIRWAAVRVDRRLNTSRTKTRASRQAPATATTARNAGELDKAAEIRLVRVLQDGNTDNKRRENHTKNEMSGYVWDSLEPCGEGGRVPDELLEDVAPTTAPGAVVGALGIAVVAALGIAVVGESSTPRVDIAKVIVLTMATTEEVAALALVVTGAVATGEAAVAVRSEVVAAGKVGVDAAVGAGVAGTGVGSVIALEA